MRSIDAKQSDIILTLRIFYVLLVILVFAGALFLPVQADAADARCSDPAFLGQHMNDGVCTGNNATGASQITTAEGLIARLEAIVTAIVPFIIGLAVLVILWGIFGYISHAGEEEKRQESKLFIIWGIVGLFFMVSLWGLVNVLDITFKTNKELPPLPHLPTVPH